MYKRVTYGIKAAEREKQQIILKATLVTVVIVDEKIIQATVNTFLNLDCP
jgi:hypothetical protein